ncbi:EamA family transporter [Geothrix sp. PMB-07]|uniref:EamA family transporter n=1 Tax=Geothrix sp. PMB-07 TaxID=3068640 RepID=UPI0027405470|nr:EamA family transporter [Geothrix sp. PMB-07]WLT30283.1 EamA family transporter [Geothrix sp. PMB-07]
MLLLLLVSVLWALSFGLTAQVSGLGAPFVTAARTLLAALVFLPFLRVGGLKPRQILGFLGIGALQFGLMYLLYIASFRWLQSSEVALFTIFTPLFVTLVGDLLEGRRSWFFLVVASIAVLGTGICVWTGLGRTGLLWGFLLMQGANFCFALGQVLYRRVAPASGKSDHQLMGLLYLGASAVAVAMAAPSFHWHQVLGLTLRQGWVLVYLGVVASGLGFFLFNAGARRTDLGTLAIFNNMKIPLAILASGLIFHEPVAWSRLMVGGSVIALALGLNAVLGERP